MACICGKGTAKFPKEAVFIVQSMTVLKINYAADGRISETVVFGGGRGAETKSVAVTAFRLTVC